MVLALVHFVGLVACAAALNLGQFVVRGAAAVAWAAAAAAVVWAASAVIWAADVVVWAALTAYLGIAVMPVHVAV